jgi:hypothetical protein
MIGLEPADPKFGFWEVCGQRYRNKLQAVTAAVPQGHWPHFNFNDAVFGSYDWSRPPAQELGNLYKQRARTLRERYDYVTIDFSGGADSWNVVWSFLSQGLHVDKLIYRLDVNSSQSPDDKSSANCAAEGRFSAYPWFKKWQELDPNLSWHTHEITEQIIQGWSANVLDPLQFNNLHPGYITKIPFLINDNAQVNSLLGRSVSITGCDKPNLLFESGKFYLYFPDGVILHRGVIDRAAIDKPNDDVMFYWDPECCDLLCQQAHLVMNWFRAHPQMLPLISNRHYRNNESYYKIVNAVVYPEYEEIWQTEKAKGFNLMTHETWFAKDYQTTRHGRNWAQSVQTASDIIQTALTGTKFSNWMHQEHDYWHLAGSISRLYYLGDL